MIAHLAGELTAAGETWVVIDVGGGGYRVTVTRAAAEALRGTEGAVRLHTRMIVRDDDSVMLETEWEKEMNAEELLKKLGWVHRVDLQKDTEQEIWYTGLRKKTEAVLERIRMGDLRDECSRDLVIIGALFRNSIPSMRAEQGKWREGRLIEI